MPLSQMSDCEASAWVVRNEYINFTARGGVLDGIVQQVTDDHFPLFLSAHHPAPGIVERPSGKD